MWKVWDFHERFSSIKMPRNLVTSTFSIFVSSISILKFNSGLLLCLLLKYHENNFMDDKWKFIWYKPIWDFLKFMINTFSKLAKVSVGKQNICVIGENNIIDNILIPVSKIISNLSVGKTLDTVQVELMQTDVMI